MIAALLLPVMLGGCAPTVRPAGQTVRAPTLTGEHYVAADGTALPLAVWTAKGGTPTAVVLGLHGFGDYRDAWDEPAAIWAEAGITTYAFDQRGFGASPTRGRWAGTDSLVEDARTVAMLLRRRHPGVPFYVAGESMGAAVTLVAADNGIEADGLVLVAPALRSRETFGPVASAGIWFFAHTIPWLPAGPTSIDYKPTDNPKTLKKLQSDPLMLRQPRLDMGYGLLDLMDAARDSAERLRMPYIMLYGMGDRIVPEGPIRSAIALMPRRAGSKLALYKDGYHMLLRDKDGPTVARDVVAWMTDHDMGLPSGADSGKAKPELAALWGSRRVQR